ICFGSSWHAYSNEPVVYGEKTLKDALTYIRSISANMGGTELRDPMTHVCRLAPIKGFSRDVILLTDGEVSYPDEVIHEVHKAADTLRVFSFGIGYGASHHLVKGVARASGGMYEMIQPGEKIQPKVLRQFSRMSQPVITDVTLELKGGKIDLPPKLPPIFEGDDYTIFAKVTDYKGEGGEIIFTGHYLGNLCSWKAPVKQIDADNTIPVLWALSKVKQLKEETMGGSNQVDRKRKSVEKTITGLGLAYSFLTEYTSFVAVEKRESGEKTEGQPEYRRIPVQLTKDWHGTGGGIAVNKPMSMTDKCLSPCEPLRAPMSKSSFLGNLFGGGMGSKDKRKMVKHDDIRARKTHFTEDLKSEAPANENLEWYLALLGTQGADGHFAGKAIVAAYFKIPEKEIDAKITQIDGPDEALKEKAFITLLAVIALRKDPGAYAISKRAIKKAEKWLSDNAPVITIGGKKAGEYISENYKMS
ncbi:MAG: hypothetical protein JXJ04_09985, partial [Spirochaetales bacterium]|nr:hypothetical protein [Spirochaetales bacterium]